MTVSWSDFKEKTRDIAIECWGGPLDGMALTSNDMTAMNPGLVRYHRVWYALRFSSPRWFWEAQPVLSWVRMGR